MDRKIEADRRSRQAEERAQAGILQAERDRLAQWRDTVPGQACSSEEDCDKHSGDHFYLSDAAQWRGTATGQGWRRKCHRHNAERLSHVQGRVLFIGSADGEMLSWVQQGETVTGEVAGPDFRGCCSSSGSRETNI